MSLNLKSRDRGVLVVQMERTEEERVLCAISLSLLLGVLIYGVSSTMERKSLYGTQYKAFK